MDKTLRPELFVDLNELAPDILVELKYFDGDNFVGQPIDGYRANRCWLTRPAATALAHVQRQLSEVSLGLKVFDGYRPQRAVDHFIRWTESPGEGERRADFFPDLSKSQLFSEGYLIRRSSHSRGSTVDLTLVDAASGEELEMGTRFDLFGPGSWIDSRAVSGQAQANRLLLRELMGQHGFLPFHQEWWHFTLQDEPFPDRYFDFPVE
ncbi:M15 family metallopeptidase [Marinobacterium arenosum]|uniref:M15 family metallopeptidase n=1 Tax=Marinobacterium arenosum TaxID=2862496 RepID=UPI001C97EE3E|nr:M15 family metallopeptidase [Marinobacterium arenosum]MBY4678342.1 M15 family metallopeptidase [Marinobacterium arenosum]